MSGVNYYQLLGIHASATDGEIRRAYLRLSLQYHPDKRRTPDASADEFFRSIQEAYETLSCPEKRCLYDFVGSFAALAEVTSSRPIPMPAFQDGRQHRRGAASAAADPHLGGLWSRSSSGETLHSWGTSSMASASRLSPCPSSSDTHLSSSPAGATALSESGSGSGVRICNITALYGDPAGCRGGGAAAISPAQAPVTASAAAAAPPEGCSGGGSAAAAAAAHHPPQPHVLLGPAHAQQQQHQLPYGGMQGRAPPPPELKLPHPSDPYDTACLGGHAGESPNGSFTTAGGGGGSGFPVTSPGTLLGKRRTPGADEVEVLPHPHPHPHSHYQSSQQPEPSAAQVLLGRTIWVSTTGLPSPGAGGGCAAAAAVPAVPVDGRRVHSADVHHRLLLTLEEMYSGCVKQLRLARRVYRPADSAALSSSPPPPPGVVQQHQMLQSPHPGPDPQQQQELPPLEATGGQSCLCVEELFRVVVQPGWREGTKVTFPGKGDELPCGSRGDMILVVVQAAHGRYERRGNDLHTVVVVPLVDALTGGDTAITTLDGRRLVLQLGPACLQPFSECVVKGEGMPIPPGKAARSARGVGVGVPASASASAAPPPAGSTAQQAVAARGDLHVRFEVSFPADLTLEQKAELRQALLPL